MKRESLKCVAVLMLATCLLCACGKDNIINRTNIYDTFNLEYKYFNSEDTCQFELSKGQYLRFDVQTLSGSAEVKVVDLDNNELFYEDILVTKSFDVVPKKEGRYIVILTGHKAEGMIDITVWDEDTK